MNLQNGSRHARLFFAVAIMLLAVGLAVDFAFVQPRLQEVKSLENQRSQLLGQVSELSERDREGRFLAEYLNLEDLADMLSASGESDPVVFVGQMLDQSQLTRLELTSGDNSNQGPLKRTKITLRVMGGYNRIVDFVRSLEQGPRLVTVDALSIEKMLDSASLEGRLSISVYDPIVRR